MSAYEDFASDVDGIVSSFTASGHGSGAVFKTLRRLSALGWQIPAEVTVRIAEAQNA
jgi:hypothetical protein